MTNDKIIALKVRAALEGKTVHYHCKDCNAYKGSAKPLRNFTGDLEVSPCYKCLRQARYA